MSKPEKIYIDGYDFYCWKYEEQTKMKHLVLVEYFKVWAQKLGKFHALCYFDCHGGCGAYVDNGSIEWGSPILIAKESEFLKKDYNKDVAICVFEKDKDNCENLSKVIEYNHLNPKPALRYGDFESIVLKPEFENYVAYKPCLYFIDPFGYSLKMSTLKRLLATPRKELIINFMFDYINRFLSCEELSSTFDDLYGCTEWKQARSLSYDEREKFLVNLFKEQLKKITNVKYVYPYKLSFFGKKKTYYYLFHATNHIDGCSLMKSCFASQNFGKVEYLGRRNNEITLFDMDDYKTHEIKTYLMNRFKGQVKTFDDILAEIIDDTLYLESGIRTAIHDLKSENLVSIKPVDSKTERGLRGRDEITF